MFVLKTVDFPSFSVHLLTVIIYAVRGQQQYFRVQPRDLKVQEGGEAMLECEVANVAGQVQWTKDGFALGEFVAIIPSLFHSHPTTNRRDSTRESIVYILKKNVQLISCIRLHCNPFYRILDCYSRLSTLLGDGGSTTRSLQPPREQCIPGGRRRVPVSGGTIQDE